MCTIDIISSPFATRFRHAWACAPPTPVVFNRAAQAARSCGGGSYRPIHAVRPAGQVHPERKRRTLAYQVLGDGPLDLVFLFGWPSHLALMWENPAFADFLHRLASFSRLILFDRRGNGMSDRGPTGHAFEDWMDDVRAVMTAVGSERAAFFGCHLGGRLALLFAATHPEQTTAVVTFAAHPATLRDDDYPWGRRRGAGPAHRPSRRRELDPDSSCTTSRPRMRPTRPRAGGGRPTGTRPPAPPESVDEITAMGPVDIRGVLGAVRPRRWCCTEPVTAWPTCEASRYMADRLPRRTFRELPGDDHFPFFGDQDAVVALTQEFLTGTSGRRARPRGR